MKRVKIVPTKRCNPAAHDQQTASAIRKWAQEHDDSFFDYEHTFILRNLYKSCFYETIMVDFIPNRSSTTKRSNEVKKIHAIFNKDRRHYTPAFINGQDIIDYEQTPQYDKIKFKEKLADVFTRQMSSQNKQKMWIPKPSNKNCQVCERDYEDYLEHIASEEHKKRASKSKAQKYIDQLVAKVSKNYGQGKIHDEQESSTGSPAAKNKRKRIFKEKRVRRKNVQYQVASLCSTVNSNLE